MAFWGCGKPFRKEMIFDRPHEYLIPECKQKRNCSRPYPTLLRLHPDLTIPQNLTVQRPSVASGRRAIWIVSLPRRDSSDMMKIWKGGLDFKAFIKRRRPSGF